MPIEPISGVNSALPTPIARPAAEPEAASGSSFADVLSTTLENARQADAQDKASTAALLSGEDEAIHTALIAAQKAELALSLAIQVRNKVIEAYNEVMHMQL